MRTTIRIDDRLFAEVKKIAAEENQRLTSVIEDALRELVDRRHRTQRAAPLKLTVYKGSGLQAGIDLDDSASLLEVMDS